MHAAGYQFVLRTRDLLLRTSNLYYGWAIPLTDDLHRGHPGTENENDQHLVRLLLRATIVGTPVLRAKATNIWYECIIKLMILSGRPEWIFQPNGETAKKQGGCQM